MKILLPVALYFAFIYFRKKFGRKDLSDEPFNSSLTATFLRIAFVYLPLGLLFIGNGSSLVLVTLMFVAIEGYFSKKRETGDAKQLARGVLNNIFGILGALCKTDGQISKDEIEIVERYLRETLRLNEKDRGLAIDAFREGARQGDYLVRAQRLKGYFGNDPHALLLTLKMVQELSLAGGAADPREQRIVLEICKVWGIRVSYSSQDSGHTARDKVWEDVKPKSVGPFEYFGCTSQSTAKELKSAYREMCKLYHPDVARTKAFHPDYSKHAEEKFKEVQNMWEEVRALRSDL